MKTITNNNPNTNINDNNNGIRKSHNEDSYYYLYDALRMDRTYLIYTYVKNYRTTTSRIVTRAIMEYIIIIDAGKVLHYYDSLKQYNYNNIIISKKNIVVIIQTWYNYVRS